MAYTKTTTLIARRGYSGLGGVADFLSNLLSSYNKTEQQIGAANQATQSAAANAAAGGGISTTDVLLVGGVAVAAILLLRKKKSA